MKIINKSRSLLVLLLSLSVMAAKCERGFDADLGEAAVDDDTAEETEDFDDFQGVDAISELSVNEDQDRFIMTRTSVLNTEIEGSLERFSSTGFSRFTLDEAVSGVDATFDGIGFSNEIWITENPESSGNTDRIQILIGQTQCPSRDLTANLFTHLFSTNTPGTDGYGVFGVLTVHASTDAISESIQYALPANSSDFTQVVPQNAIEFAAGTCADGVTTVSGNTYYFSDAAVLAEVASTANTSSTQLFAADADDIGDIKEIANYTNYLGFLRDTESGNELIKFTAECNLELDTTPVVCGIFESTNVSVDNDASNGATANYTLTLDGDADAPQEGYVTGTLGAGSAPVQPIACSVDLNFEGSNDMLMLCNGLSPAGNGAGISLVLKGD